MLSSEEEIGNVISNKQSSNACYRLEEDQGIAKLLFVSWTEEAEPCIYQSEVVWHALQPVGLLVEFWKSVSWAVDDAQQLWERKGEIDKLWNEEQHESLGEVTKDANNCEGHTSTVAESITDEYF